MTASKLISLSYFLSVALLAASLPVSRTFISVFQFCLAGIFILEGISYKSYLEFYRKHNLPALVLLFLPFHLRVLINSLVNQIKRIGKNRLLLVFLLFSATYLLGLTYTSNFNDALRVLRNKLPILLIPLFFTAINSISKEQKNIILLLFVLSASISSLISLSIFLGGRYEDLRRISPFISHIHLAIFINYSIFIIYYFLRSGVVKHSMKIPAYLLFLWLVIFQVSILKSLTGIVILFMGCYFMLIFNRVFQLQMSKVFRYALIIFLPAIFVSPILFSLIRFYDIKHVNHEELDKYTEQGNPYLHDFNVRMLENGNYVYLYISEKELREGWNKVSGYDYDSLDDKGHEIKHTLFRYMTSKGLRKDAAGLNQLDSADINMIENGYSNHIYLLKLSLYPRIYQVIWELDMYSKTGNPKGQSVAQRLESIKMGWQIAKRHPFFGIGTGNLVARYHKQYEKSGSLLPEDMRITGANQFLNFIVNFGIIGFMIILFSWLYPAIKQKAFSNPLFAMFFFIAVAAMFSEEILRFQTGITFFAFFYSFFIFIDARGNHSQDNTNSSN